MVHINVWGPIYWRLIHVIVFALPDDVVVSEKLEIVSILKSICVNIPCPTCQEHATAFMNRIRWTLVRNKWDFLKLLNDFHNSVNKRLKKKSFTLEESIALISQLDTKVVCKDFVIISSKRPQGMSLFGMQSKQSNSVTRICAFIKKYRSHYKV